MALPIRRDSVNWVENTHLAITDDDTEAPGVPSDDSISLPPSLRSLPDLSLSLRSSPDLPDMEEFLAYHKQLRSSPGRVSFSSLPNSSLLSSPASAKKSSSLEVDSIPGRVYLYEKVLIFLIIYRPKFSSYQAREDPWCFDIPSSNSFFCPINSFTFLDQTRIITHPLKVYDTMKGGFGDLPPTAFWRQYSPNHYLIVKEKRIANYDCPGLSLLIKNLEDPVDVMSQDEVCQFSWRQSQTKAPSSARDPSPETTRFQQPSYADQGVQTIQSTEGKKRKRDAIEVNVSEPLRKILRLFRGGSGDSFNDPIVVMDD